MTGETILLVEDDDGLRRALTRYLRGAGASVIEAGSCAEGARQLSGSRVDFVLSDVLLPDGLGFDLAERAIGCRPRPGVIVMTADDRIDHAIRAVRQGACDFLLKPFSMQALDEALDRARQRLKPLASAAPSTSEAIDSWRRRHAPRILGSHRSLMRVFGIIERVCDTDCSVLITGESGTGKELVARALHDASDRRDRPFVTVNCAAIPENLLESELFGHARGAFTGATAARPGCFVAADGGTLFLDEIGELPLSLQAKLLRAIQEKEITPVGDHRARKVDVRIVSATNRDLDKMVEDGSFREDLLYRLNVIPIELPPLRERRSDIPELVREFVLRANERRGRLISGVSQELLEALCNYDWPGNVRQLENTLERMVVLRSEGELGLEDLPRSIADSRKGAPTGGEPILPDEGIDLRDAVEEFENALILQALERTGWNKNRAASILRMNRTTLVEKLKKKRLEHRVA